MKTFAQPLVLLTFRLIQTVIGITMGRRTSTSSTTGSTHVNTTLTPPSPLAWALHPSAPTRPHVRRMACRMSLPIRAATGIRIASQTWPNSTVNSIRAPSTYPNPRRLQPQPRRLRPFQRQHQQVAVTMTNRLPDPLSTMHGSALSANWWSPT